jgi:hypothetical protein
MEAPTLLQWYANRPNTRRVGAVCRQWKPRLGSDSQTRHFTTVLALAGYEILAVLKT